MATIAEALALALDHHLAGRLAEAQELYHRILDAEPDQPDALHFLGVLAGQVGEHALGLQLLARALAQRPEAADMHANIANLWRGAGRTGEAVACYRRAIALQPDCAEAWTDMADALHRTGDTGRAIPALERAVAAAPALEVARARLGALLHERGRLLVEAGRGVEALPALSRAAALMPQDADVAFLHGNALFALGLREDSLAAYRKALAITPDFPSAAFNLGIALGTVDRLPDSAAALEHAARLDTRHTEAIDRLVVALVLLGREEEAVAWGERALALKKRTATADAPVLPALPAAPRGAAARHRKVIAFGLSGGRDDELRVLLDNLRLAPTLHPGWWCRVYHGAPLPPDWLAELAEAGAEPVAAGTAGVSAGAYARLAVADDPEVARFLCRDAAVPLTPTQAAAVAGWEASGLPFHVMRDGVLDTEVMPGGQWAGVAGLLPDLRSLVERHAAAEPDADRFLRRIVWPMIRDRALVHDRHHRGHGLPFPG